MASAASANAKSWVCMSAMGARPDSIRRMALRYPDEVTPMAPRTLISFITMRSEMKSSTGLNPLRPASTTVPPGRAIASASATGLVA